MKPIEQMSTADLIAMMDLSFKMLSNLTPFASSTYEEERVKLTKVYKLCKQEVDACINNIASFA